MFRGEISNLSILVDHIIFISWFLSIGRISFFFNLVAHPYVGSLSYTREECLSVMINLELIWFFTMYFFYLGQV
jgi:hypothetical protein